MSKEYFDVLYERYGCIFPIKGSSTIPKYFIILMDTFKNHQVPNEPLVSCYIQRMLTELMLISSDSNANANTDKIDTANPIIDAITFIKSNFKNKITLEDLSSKVNLSSFYFSRRFKKETGYSPYEYIIMERLNEAKKLLKSTKMLIKEIAYFTGFQSESSFVTCFKNNTNVTPSEFRNTPF